MEEYICRLCLNFVKNEFEQMDAVTRQMFQVLSLKVDLDVCKNPILCKNCAELTKKSYFFKSTCRDTEELILSYASARENAEFDIKDVYKDSKGTHVVVDEDFSVCRFCMREIERIDLVSIDVLMNDERYNEMLPIFMPEIVVNIIKDPVICTPCRENLESYFKFTRKCLDTEEKINKYLQNEGIHSTSQIRLSKVLSFLFKDSVSYSSKSPQISVIKQEKLFEDEEQNADCKIHEELIKCETLDIKGEDLYLPEENEENNFEIHKEYPFNYETKPEGTRHDILAANYYKTPPNVEMYKCEICSHETSRKRHLKRHMVTHMDTSEVEMHKCTICTFETKHKVSHKTHMLTHKDASEVEMHKCTICTYETKYKRHLKRHMLMHKDASEVEMHKCETCTYETKYKYILRKHMLMHKDSSEVEMYKCAMCFLETKHKSYLIRHMDTHRGTSEVEMHKCTICTFETKYKKCLKRHMLTHKDASEVEMHKCTICTFETKRKGGLMSHMLTHKDSSEVEMHKCGMCAFETKHKRYLKKHVLRHERA